MSQKYNLRSGKKETVLPVQLQLCDDYDFVSQMLGSSHPTPAQWQVVSDSESGSDLECSDLINTSDNDHDDADEHRSYDRFSAENIRSDSTDTDTAQQLVNQTILQQLEKISARLDNLEKKNCKKTVDQSKIKNKKFQKSYSSSVAGTLSTASPRSLGGTSQLASGHIRQAKVPVKHTQTQSVAQVRSDTRVPSLQEIKCDSNIQVQVDQRLRELADLSQTGISNKVKSQRGGQVEVLVQNRVKWPHEFVLAGSTKERISYDQLSMVQWMAGFCRTMREENDQNLRSHMLNYLIDLLDDAQDFSWTAAKASHAVLLCCMEQGEVSNYDQVDRIDCIRRANAQKHVIGNPQSFPGPNNAKKNVIRPSRTMPCQFFNQGMCSHNTIHETKGVLYKHICSFCFTSANKSFSHTESECRNKKKSASKNEEARA